MHTACTWQVKSADPYARFTLLNGRSGVTETGRTQPVYNTLEPVWAQDVQLMLAAGTEAAMGLLPKLLVRVYDKDLTDSDDLLGECEVVLTECERQGRGDERLMLKGVGPHADCAMSFS